jgi:hypothetical protein
MKKAIWIPIFLLWLTQTKAQNYNFSYQQCLNCTGNASTNQTYNFGNTTNYITSDILSDFGRRRGVAITNWHRGIDFSSVVGDGDVGYHIMPVLGGVVSYLDVADDYKYISVEGVQNFGYGHIFRDGKLVGNQEMRSGDMVLKHMLPPNQLQFTIIYDPGNGTPVAIGYINGGRVEYNGDTLTVTNQVAANRPIAPIGNSGKYFVGKAHVHLYNPHNGYINPQDINNGKNPLEFVTHAQPTYTVSIEGVNNLTLTGTNTFYPGNVIASVKVRCAMNGEVRGSTYNNATLNIDDVRLFIKKDYENDQAYQLIKGPNVQSRISLGGKNDSVRYPSTNHPAGNSTIDISDDNRIGSNTIFGIDPYAYDDYVGDPWDEYYFSDIKTRIHKNDNFGQGNPQLALINQDARYPDGQYTLKVKATTIRGVPYDGTTTPTILIDNFRPYVETLTVQKTPILTVVYQGNWNWNGTSLSLVQNFDTVKTPCNLLVRVTTSEPMRWLSLHFLTFSDSLTQAEVGSGNKTWVFNIPSTAFNLAPDGFIPFYIRGNDYAGNPLQVNANEIAIRGANGS